MNPDEDGGSVNSSPTGVDHTPAGGKPARGRAVTVADGVLRDGETVSGQGRCWAALRRDRVPLLALARRQYELVLTDRRLLLLARGKRQRRHLGLGPDGIALEHDLDLLRIERERSGWPLHQVLVRLPTGRTLVLELGPAQRALARDLAARLVAA